LNFSYEIPDSAAKYILFQRTTYITLTNNIVLRLLRKLIPAFSYNSNIAIEALLRNNRIKSMYLRDMQREYLSIKEFLPTNCSIILDIGCGISGISLFLNRHYSNSKIQFYLLDKSIIEKNVYYFYNRKGAFYNSLEIAKEMLVNNGLHTDKVHLLEATNSNSIMIRKKVNLVISLLSWGFHYPIDTYLDRVYEILDVDGVLILDVRENTNGLHLLTDKFSDYKPILKKNKYLRVCVRK